MKPCEKHWAAMRKKIDDLGLSQFVSGSGQEAMEREKKHLDSFLAGGRGMDPKDWDPLMAMLWNFTSRVMDGLGRSRGPEAALGLMSHDPAPGAPNEGHHCPLCIVRQDFDAHNTPTGKCGRQGCETVVKPGDQPWDENWIDSCGEAMLEYAVESGLVRRQ